MTRRVDGKLVGAPWIVYLALAAGTAAAQVNTATLQKNTVLAEIRRAEIVPPVELARAPARQAVMLQAEATSVTLQNLEVLRRIDVASLRAQPLVQLQQGRANMAPLLANPASIANVAERLEAFPQLATVKASALDIIEIEQGIVVRQYLAYQLKTGVCTDPVRRASLAQPGVDCFEQIGLQARMESLANPADPRYIANARQRRAAALELEQMVAADRADIASQVAVLRGMLTEPVSRAEIEAEIGVTETRRLAALDDETLATELINTAEVEIEEVLFVPGAPAPGHGVLRNPNFARTAPSETLLVKPGVRSSAVRPQAQLEGITIEPRAATAERSDQGARLSQRTIDESQPIAEAIYVTGFTFGREHEWRWRVSLKIKWCITGCTRTYFLEPYAGYSFGFGLRFPIRMTGTYRYQARGGRERATFIPDFSPFDAAAEHYRRAGIDSGQLFDGQELVAEAGAWAGFKYKLPFDRRGDVGFDFFFDATQRLPEPYRNGQLRPPAPGTRVPPVEVVFTDIDLIGGRANFRVVGARVRPAIRFDLTSDKLKFDLFDRVSGETRRIDRSGHFYDLAITSEHRSRFVVRDPVYNLTFSMTPGIVPNVFVDIALWSKQWHWPVWFPRLEIEIPRGGIDFSCHAGTTCANNYDFRPRSLGPQPRASTRTRGPGE